MLQLYNYLTRKKDIFKPLKRGRVGLYTCGPTVYNFAHIGNLRTYIFEDVLRRVLEFNGYTVRQIMNLTDVDDKTIRDSKKAGKSLKEFTEFYAKAFFADIKKLNILPAWKYPRATGHIKEMIALIQTLLKKRLAYRTEDGIYFDISRFRPYGKLSRVKQRKLKAGARVSADEYSKAEAQDFALWKAKKPKEPWWPAPFGQGRPGWHIECSAMSMKYLGASFDIHAGGVDLVFPHHEDEIAQSEGAAGRQFVRYFVEGEHLMVDGKKMSKSLGNIYTLRDLKGRGFDPLSFRYLVLGAHYRSQLNFTWQALEAASSALIKLKAFVAELAGGGKNRRRLGEWRADFETALRSDLDTPRALAVVWKLVNAYRKNPDEFNPAEVKKLLFDFDRVLGLNLKARRAAKIPEKIMMLVAKRELLRKEKKWQKADAVREKIKKLGYAVEDRPSGPIVKKL